MAQVTGTTWTSSVANSISMGTNVRESVEDVIWLLDPMDTWAANNLPRGEKPGNTYHEWTYDDLDAATTNAQIEGDDTSFSTAAGSQRVGNYLQILKKSFLVSGTLEEVNKVGRKSEIARLATKRMKEVKRDLEKALVGNQASSAGGSGTARSMASMESWIAGPTATTAGTAANVVAATTSSGATTPGWASGTVAAPTDGTTTGALTEGQLKAALQGSWEDGGDPRVILVGATQKKVIDTFTGIATRFVDSSPRKEATIIGAANMYVTEFGSPHMVVLSRYVRASVVLCIDPEYWAVSFLRPFFTEKLSKSGDGEKRHILGEATLVCRNPKASSKVVACA
jgi:hypothetical protein